MQPSNASLRGEEGPNPEQPDPTGALIWSAVSVAVGISAIVFGVKGAEAREGRGIGTDLGHRRVGSPGIVSVAVPTLRATGVHQHHQPLTFEAHRSMRTWRSSARGAGPRGVRQARRRGLGLVWAHGAWGPTLRHDGPPLDMQQAFS